MQAYGREFKLVIGKLENYFINIRVQIQKPRINNDICIV